MSGSDSTKKNDVRGWVLVHRQIRGEVADQANQVAALVVGDSRAAAAVSRWWLSFSASVAHHMRAEDERIWPQLRSLAPDVSEPLTLLEDEHRRILRLLVAVDAKAADLPAAVTAPDFDGQRAELEAAIRELGVALEQHLNHEEELVRPVFEQRVSAGDWMKLEQDMVKGLGPREMADLLPRMLSYADADTRAMMLATRLPAPVRLLDRLVFEPRDRRRRTRLPLGRTR
jgi:iron-sulfur cluster repair protein YtfE (RIC family)